MSESSYSSFDENPADSEAVKESIQSSQSPGPGEASGDKIDRYTLLEKLGEGGMGSVWMAQQSEPVKRRVALKIIKLGMDTREVVKRFEIERQALALMDHPHIAKVFDGGATEGGRPFFVMELARGMPITLYCDEAKLGLRARLDLFNMVCAAIQHAHSKGIIHRDIKPSNILVTLRDGVPMPKVIDFGIAKATCSELTHQTFFTTHGQIIGTPDYMAPEQADASGLDIDTRADIYSLGVLLYELLTGKRPLDISQALRTGYEEMVRIIREVDPAKPSTRISNLGNSATSIALNRHADTKTLNKHLQGDLDWIVLKALEKDRTRRYETASAFAADVVRHLNNEDVDAAPPNTRYRLGKFVRRHKRAAVMAITVASLLIVGSIGTGIGWWKTAQANRALDIALNEKADALEEEQRQRSQAQKNETRARTAEQAAQREAQRATQAESNSRMRAEELEQVSSFQAEQLSGLDVALMGTRLRAAILEGVPKESRGELAAKLAGLNFTNLALGTLRENLFDRTVEAIDSLFEEQPLVQAQLLQSTAGTLRQLGLLELALDPQERALIIRRRELGNEDPGTLSSVSNMGILLYAQGKLSEAESYYREALEGNRRVLGDEHSSTLTSINNMGFLLDGQGKLTEAEAYYREALEGKRRVLGNEHPDTLSLINNMGALLRAQGKLTEAEAYYREALECNRRNLGDVHPDTLRLISNMGVLLRDQGKLMEAELYSREALEGRRLVLGDEHPETLTSIANMGHLLRSQGKLIEAEPYCREALEGRRRVLGDEHPNTLTSINNMGLLLQNQGRLIEAEPYCRKALEGYRLVLGDEHTETLTSIGNLGSLLSSQGKYTEAEPYCREALAGRRRVLGDEHPNTLTSINNMGLLLQNQGRLIEAEPYCREALEGNQRVLGDEHPDTLNSIGNMGGLLQAQGKLSEAEPYYREALEGKRRVLGDEHPGTLISINNMGLLLKDQGKLMEAEVYFREALEGSRRVLGDEHPKTLTLINNMGTLFEAQGSLTEAETYYRKTTEGLRHVLGDAHPNTLTAINNLDRVLRALLKSARSSGSDLQLGQALAKLGTLSLSRGSNAEAEELLSESLDLLFSKLPEHDLRPWFAQASLGAAIGGQGRFDEAEFVLLESAAWMIETGEQDSDDGESQGLGSTALVLQHVVGFYTAWHASKPTGGYDQKADQWQLKLDAWMQEHSDGGKR